MPDGGLGRAAATTLDRLGVRPEESLLVLYNPELAGPARAIVAAARLLGCKLRELEFPPTTRNGAEPPAEVAKALLQANAAALLTTFSLSHTRARLAATEQGVRIASMPGVTAEIFARSVPADYALLEARGRALARLLTAAERCHIATAAGTKLELVLSGREGRSDDGDLRVPGAFGNLPAGEAYIAPLEERVEGVIVFDGSVASSGLLREPLRVDVTSGHAVAARGGKAASLLLATLDAGGATGRVIAELGIGTNPFARVRGRVIEDEKAEGTIHVAFGTNTGIGGVNASAVHIDGIVRDPTVELDGETIMHEGSLLT